MTYNNTYTRGQIWAQALKAGRDLHQRLEPMLKTRRIGHSIARFDDVGSTNAVAVAWASEGVSEGAVVLAEHQQEGRGRLGRRWLDVSGKNLMFSVVFRPRLKPDEMGLIMLAASVSVSAALAQTDASLFVQIKWPNDVLLNGKKCCGMLMESSMPAGATGREHCAILGIGVNVNQDEFPPEFAHRTTSLALETGRLFDRLPLLASILNRLDEQYDRVLADDGASVRAAYVSRLHGLNRLTEVYTMDGASAARGRILGVSPVGALLLETEEGVQSLSSGEITFRPGS